MSNSKALDEARRFAGSILHASDEALDALTLICAVTHCIDQFDIVPRGVATADGPGVGKTVTLDVVTHIAQRAEIVDATGPAFKAMYNVAEGAPTICLDEAQDLWGFAGQNKGIREINNVIRQGHRRNYKIAFSASRTATKVSGYGVVFLAGLGNAIPADIRTRCIEFRLTGAPKGKTFRPSQSRATEKLGDEVRLALHSWIRQNVDEIGAAYLDLDAAALHSSLVGRKGDTWQSILAVASVAGGDWLERALRAFGTLSADTTDAPDLSPWQRIIRDAAALVGRTGAEVLSSADLVAELKTLDGELYKSLSRRELELECTEALGATKPIRPVAGDPRQLKGWRAEAILAAATRLASDIAVAVDDLTEPVIDEADYL